MKPRPLGVVFVTALGLVGCSGGGSSHPSGSHATSAAPSVIPSAPAPGQSFAEGNCDHEPYVGTPPAFASENAPGVRFVVSVHGDVVGYLFSDPLRAGAQPAAGDDKILWYVRFPRDGQPLNITARPRGARGPEVRKSFAADSAPGEIYPSSVNLPTAGCWTLHLAWGTHQDDVDVKYVP